MTGTTLIDAAMAGGILVAMLFMGVLFFYMIIMDKVREKVRDKVDERVKRHERFKHD